MDKYEYKLSAEQIRNLVSQGEYEEAAEIADGIDWRRVKSVMMLCTVSDVYKMNKRYEDARELLLLAYDRHPGGRTICYSLCELSIKMGEFVQAVEYYKEFVQIAPRDSGKYILKYKLYEAQDVSLEERIGVLEELKRNDYREKWAYELAYLYHRVGQVSKCVEECDELILWFGEGKYVTKALELKSLHQPLTYEQQCKYESSLHRMRGQNAPTVGATGRLAGMSADSPVNSQTGGNHTAYGGEEGSHVPYAQEVYFQDEQEMSNAGMDQPGGAEPYFGEPYGNTSQYNGSEEQYENNNQNNVDSQYGNAGQYNGSEQYGNADLYNDQYGGEGQNATENPYAGEGQYDLNAENQNWYSETGYENAQPDGRYGENWEQYDNGQQYGTAGQYDGNEQYGNTSQQYDNGQQYGTAGQYNGNEQYGNISQYNGQYVSNAPYIGDEEQYGNDDQNNAAEGLQIDRTQAAQTSQTEGAAFREADGAQQESVSDEVWEQNKVGESTKQEVGEGAQKSNIAQFPGRKQEEDDFNIQVETMDESQFNAINLEKEIAEGLKAVLDKEKKTTAPEAGKAPVATDTRMMDINVIRNQVKKSETEQESSLEEDMVDKQVTGQLSVEDILAEWERREKEKNTPVRSQWEEPENTMPEASISQEEGEKSDAAKAAGTEVENPVSEQEQSSCDSWQEAQDDGIYYGEEDYVEELEEIEPSEYDRMDNAASYEEPVEEVSDDAQEEAEIYEEPVDTFQEETEIYEEAADTFQEEPEPYEEAADTFREEPEPYEEAADTFQEESEPYEEVTDTFREESEPYEEAADTFPEETESYEETEIQNTITEDIPEEAEAEPVDVPTDTTDAVSEPGKAKEVKGTKKVKTLVSTAAASAEKADTEKQNSPLPEKSAKESAGKRKFTPEERELFGAFVQSREGRDRLAGLLESISLRGERGNVILTADDGVDAMGFAKNLVRDLQYREESFSGKMAKISGGAFNQKDVHAILTQLSNGALVVQRASEMDQKTCQALKDTLKEYQSGILVILEDGRKAMNKLLTRDKELAEYFDAKMELEAMSNKALVAYGIKYAKEKEYSVDELGILALHTRIEERQTSDHAVNVEEVRAIVDEAIRHAEKKSVKHFFDVLFAKRYDEEDMIILREQDFVQ